MNPPEEATDGERQIAINYATRVDNILKKAGIYDDLDRTVTFQIRDKDRVSKEIVIGRLRDKKREFETDPAKYWSYGKEQFPLYGARKIVIWRWSEHSLEGIAIYYFDPQGNSGAEHLKFTSDRKQIGKSKIADLRPGDYENVEWALQCAKRAD